MSVDDWARREAEALNDAAEEDFSRGVESAFGVDEDSFSTGAVRAFDALLSDEAVGAAARVLAGDFEPDAGELHETRLMLQAAIDAVTKGNNND